MPKTAKTEYVCSNCGAIFLKWYGRCPSCSQWNTLSEEIVSAAAAPAAASLLKAQPPKKLSQTDSADEFRFSTGLPELDRVLGGGVVKGSAVLIGGEPGAGKSTLLMQLCKNLPQGLTALYVSGEESLRQIKHRADRLGVTNDNMLVSGETTTESVIELARKIAPAVLIIDSIQTMRCEALQSAAGSVGQIRESSGLFLEYAKTTDTPVFIVGHVNKDGAIAGPKIMEHIVDTVLYFEGDKYLSFRILRAAKNRFGSTNEIGIFEMTGEGLCGVANPSAALLEGRDPTISGSAVACVLEGTRPILCEIQSLITKSGFAVPRRTASGFDYNRTNLLLAVLEKRAGLSFSTLDVYINVAGGLRVDQPGADLAVVAGILSSVFDKPAGDSTVYIGEVGLGGEIRAVPGIEACLGEIQRLGYKKCVLPKQSFDKLKQRFDGLVLAPVSSVSEIQKQF